METELDEIHGALYCYELNGSDAVAQIKSIYSDLDTATELIRKLQNCIEDYEDPTPSLGDLLNVGED
jgi:hypothetical protein